LSHANTHVAIGVIVTGIFSIFIPLNALTFFLAVCGAFAQDCDFILSKYAPEENHRRLLTHTIWPGLAAMAIGGIAEIPWIIIAGINSLVHIFFDCLDWGTTIIGGKQLRGPRLLYRGVNLEYHELKEKYQEHTVCYFTLRWYRNRVMQCIEGGSIAGMVIMFLLLNTPGIWWGILPYLGFMLLHYTTWVRCARWCKQQTSAL